jgi:hypothetical protein
MTVPAPRSWLPSELWFGEIAKHLIETGCIDAVKALRLVSCEWYQRLPMEKVYLATVTQHGWALYRVPEEHRTYALCLVAVTQDGGALEYVPLEHRTYELCLAAGTQYGWALEYVPEEHLTYELCMAAVTQCGMALRYVPAELREGIERVVKNKK